MAKSGSGSDGWLALLLAVLAIFMLRSIFDNDESKIVSKKGRRLLDDDNAMETINSRIQETERSKDPHKEIIL
jgi:hypothetical protein